VEPDAVVCEVRIDAPPETVFAFFTDPAKLTRWKGRRASLDPRPGGVYRCEMGESVARGEYVEVSPPTRVVFTWGWEAGRHGVAPGASRVEVTLEPDGTGTRVRLVHTALPPERRDSHRKGWTHYLGRLALAASGRDPGPDPLMTA
jgi:uncharacterized protein YndB with AHSA1/START domain